MLLVQADVYVRKGEIYKDIVTTIFRRYFIRVKLDKSVMYKGMGGILCMTSKQQPYKK